MGNLDSFKDNLNKFRLSRCCPAAPGSPDYLESGLDKSPNLRRSTVYKQISHNMLTNTSYDVFFIREKNESHNLVEIKSSSFLLSSHEVANTIDQNVAAVISAVSFHIICNTTRISKKIPNISLTSHAIYSYRPIQYFYCIT